MSENDLSDGIDELQEIIRDEEKRTKNEGNIKSNDLPFKKSGSKKSKKEEIVTEHLKTEEEKRLEKILFGGKEELIKSFKAAVADDETNEPEKKKRKPVWHDPDDEEICVGDVLRETRTKSIDHINKKKTYKKYLESKFSRVITTPKWADLDRKPDSDSDEEILHTVGHLSHSTTEALPANSIHVKKLKDLNRDTYAEGNITSVQFHPTSTVGLVCGYSGIASIYSIDGRKNEKLHSVYFQNFPITCAKLLPSGTEAIFGGLKSFFYSYDLIKGEETKAVLPRNITTLNLFEISPCGKYCVVSGRFGEIHLLDAKSKELIHTYKQEYACTALHFSNDSKKIFSHSKGPEINIFDLRQERIEHRFLDDGCINGRALSISPNSRMVATGSNEGVVNVYNYEDIFTKNNPAPIKVIYNLRTSISSIKFNHSSEILGICSDEVSAAVKLVHFPSGTVFANFPGMQSDLGRVKIIEFSPNSGFMALGNKSKEVPLYRLKHYNNY